MLVRRIQLTNFRNHADSTFDFADSVNFVVGVNAQGKTSVLEALSYVCITKSFLQQADATVAKIGSESFAVDATVESDRNLVNHVRVTFEPKVGRSYFLNGSELKRSSDVIGRFPIVVLSPKDFALTGGAPAERRVFVDMALSQVSHSYLDELMEYRRALKQRNRVLLDGKMKGTLDSDLLSAWTDALVSHGTRVMRKRKEFVEEFRLAFSTAYSSLIEHGEKPDLVYEPSFALAGRETESPELFYAALERLDKVERARGATLAGPHRDDVRFILNDMPIREFASQGQHKTFLVALKIAEFHYIKSKLNETPAMLLDDVMTELDFGRATKTVQAISTLGQAFITATDMVDFDEKLLDLKEAKLHQVRDGSVLYEHVYQSPASDGGMPHPQ
jgi:DNA replication and repair protein RecF